jgi:CBS domain-containing protein
MFSMGADIPFRLLGAKKYILREARKFARDHKIMAERVCFMSNKILPDIVRYPVTYRLPVNATVRDAAVLMADKSVGVVLVVDGETLCGIFSERDLTARVVANGLNPALTPLRNVMTNDVVTIRPDGTAEEALSLMQAYHCRHLPVMDNGAVVAMVSIRDLYRAMNAQLSSDLKEVQAFVFHPY